MTIGGLLAGLPTLGPAAHPDPAGVPALLAVPGIDHTTWAGRQRLDAHEIGLGRGQDRRIVKRWCPARR